MLERIQARAPETMSRIDLTETLATWQAAGECRTVASLRAYLATAEAGAREGEAWRERGLLPWEELEEVLRGLLTDL